MLLLTAVTFGGSESTEALEGLPPEDAELLKHRAQELLQIPKDKRIPLLVQEIKRLVLQRRRLLSSAEPERLAELLSSERAATQEVVLRALPSSLADGVRKVLPAKGISLRKEVKPEVLDVVRWKLEESFIKKLPAGGVFKFSDLLNFQARELWTLCDRMGARALATAIAGLEKSDRQAFFAELPPDQRSLASRASEAGASRRLLEEDAKAILDQYDARKNPSQGLRSAGAQRLARACLAHSPEFATRVVERHGGELGKLLARWLREERTRSIRGDGGRADILEQIERLAHKGMIDRPLRLPPPLKRPPQQLPGGKLLVPAPKGFSKPPGALNPPPERKRDLVAEREARKAGLPSARPPVSLLGPPRIKEGPGDDEKTIPAQTPPQGAGGKLSKSPVLTRPPQSKNATRSPGTLLERSVRPSGSRTSPKGHKRGPRGGSR